MTLRQQRTGAHAHRQRHGGRHRGGGLRQQARGWVLRLRAEAGSLCAEGNKSGKTVRNLASNKNPDHLLRVLFQSCVTRRRRWPLRRPVRHSRSSRSARLCSNTETPASALVGDGEAAPLRGAAMLRAAAGERIQVSGGGGQRQGGAAATASDSACLDAKISEIVMRLLPPCAARGV